ncbi:MAG: N-formylglutamate amidohydrolase, partial [Emcibacteraceae bacterium]|nr:N-formylglutamate amidohydrolase [Emcibacteraceae bacterium]
MTLYSLYKPTQKTNNIIYNSPHSGECFPRDFLTHTPIDKYTLLSSGDSFVDQLYKSAPDHGSILLANNYARSFMDTNRAAYELDRSMFSGDIPEQLLNHSHKVDLGYGSIAKYAYTRKDIYVTKIPFAEAEARIKEYYFPIHETLAALLSDDHEKYGYTVLIDCHSMPSYEFLNFKSAMAPQPDIVIGNLYGNSCSIEFTDYIKNYFENTGLTVALND